MVHLFFLVLEFCSKHLRLLYGIGTRYIHHIEPGAVGLSNSLHQEFDLGKPQILLLFPVLKILHVLASSTSIEAVINFQGLLKLIKAHCVW